MLIQVLLLAFACAWCNARLVNVTIDDTLGDEKTGAVPMYDDVWDAYSGTDTWGPYAGDGLQFAQYNTLHCQTGYSSSRVSLSFNGTAFYFFLFLSDDASDGIVSFTLDYHDVSPKQLPGDPSLSSPGYYQVVYKVDGLQNTQHTVDLTLSPTGFFESENAPACFDYAVYTTEAHAGAVADSEPAKTQGNAPTSPAGAKTTPASPVPAGRSGANTLRSVSLAVPLVGAIIAGIAGAW